MIKEQESLQMIQDMQTYLFNNIYSALIPVWGRRTADSDAVTKVSCGPFQAVCSSAFVIQRDAWKFEWMQVRCRRQSGLTGNRRFGDRSVIREMMMCFKYGRNPGKIRHSAWKWTVFPHENARSLEKPTVDKCVWFLIK